VKKTTGSYPRVRVDSHGGSAVGQAGGVLLTSTIRAAGLDVALRAELEPWRPQLAVHDPAKVLLDLALTLALGGDTCSDLAVLRAEPAVFGTVASDPTLSRTIHRLADDVAAVLPAIDRARAAARARVWAAAGTHAPDHGVDARQPLVVDVDATLVTAHSEKENAKPTFKKGFGFHPLCAFVDHGAAGTSEPLAIALRPGNAGSNTAADHIAVITAALAQLPGDRRRGKSVLVRIDGAGSTHKVIDWLTGRRLAYSVGFTLPENTPDLLGLIPDDVWTPAYDAHDAIRDGAWVAELTDLMDLTGWPKGMRVIVRKERPHPGAQLRFEDVEGMRITAFATNTGGGQLPDLELRHRRRARCEDRIRLAKAPPAPGRREVPPPALPTCPWPPSRRTRSGAPSLPWPLRSPPGCRCSPSPAPTRARRPTPRAGGSPSGCATGSSPSRPPSPGPGDGPGCTCPPDHRGPR